MKNTSFQFAQHIENMGSFQVLSLVDQGHWVIYSPTLVGWGEPIGVRSVSLSGPDYCTDA